MPGKFWQDSEEATLLRMARAGCKSAEVAAALGRSVDSVQSRAQTLGVSFRLPAMSRPLAAPRDRQRRKSSPASADMPPCRAKCPEGDPCCLNGDKIHELHICTSRDCECHSSARYDRARTLRARLQQDERAQFEQTRVEMSGEL